MCTSSCTTDGTCSAFPVTDRRSYLHGQDASRPRDACRHRRGPALFWLSESLRRAAGRSRASHSKPSWTRLKPPPRRRRRAHAHVRREQPELVSRPVQAGLGLFTAVLVYSAAFGGLFGLAFAFAYGGVPAPDAAGGGGIAGGHRLRRDLSRAEPEIPGESAVGRRPRNDRDSHRALFRHDRDFACGHGRIGDAEALFVPRFGEWNANLTVAACYIVLVAVAAFCCRRSTKCRTNFRPWCCGNSGSRRSARNSSCGRRSACCSAP